MTSSLKILEKFIDVINAGKETRKMLQETHQATEAHYATATGIFPSDSKIERFQPKMTFW